MKEVDKIEIKPNTVFSLDKGLEVRTIAPELISVLEKIHDPEIPVLSIMDMGVVRYAQWEDNVVKRYYCCFCKNKYKSNSLFGTISRLDNRLDHSKRTKSP